MNFYKSKKSLLFFFSFKRVHLDIDIGEHAINYQQISAREKLTELQLRVRQLLDQVEQMYVKKNKQTKF